MSWSNAPRANREELETVFLANLGVVDRILAALCRRHGLRDDEAQEFAAWAKLRLIEDDYAVLGKFRNESTLATYLTVVLAMQFREYRVQQWGRWRPSARAKRAGVVGIRLETLLHRDGVRLEEACELLRSLGLTTMSDRELRTLAASFPVHAAHSSKDTAELGEAIGFATSGGELDQRERADSALHASRALNDALAELPADDRLIVRMHHLESMSVAEISRGLSIPQKPLYRRLGRVLQTLRERLERAGISRDDIRDLSSGFPEGA